MLFQSSIDFYPDLGKSVLAFFSIPYFSFQEVISC